MIELDKNLAHDIQINQEITQGFMEHHQSISPSIHSSLDEKIKDQEFQNVDKGEFQLFHFFFLFELHPRSKKKRYIIYPSRN